MFLRIKRLFDFFRNITGKREQRQFAQTALFAVVLNLLAVIVPLLQKRILDSMSLEILNYNLLVLFFIAGIMISITSVLEVFILNNLFMSLKQRITYKLLESVTRKDNKILETRGPGTFMVSILSKEEKIFLVEKKQGCLGEVFIT